MWLLNSKMTIVVIFTVVTEMLEPQWMVFCVQCYSGKAINFIRTLRYKSLCLMSAVWGKTAQILVNFRLIYHDLSEFSTCPAKISPYIYLDEPTMYFFSFFIDGSYFCMKKKLSDYAQHKSYIMFSTRPDILLETYSIQV